MSFMARVSSKGMIRIVIQSQRKVVGIVLCVMKTLF